MSTSPAPPLPGPASEVTADCSGTSDEHLLARMAQKRDAQALAELIRRHEGTAFALAQKLCGSRELAEEALQEAFLVIWEAAASYRPVGRPKSWILAIVVHEALKQARTSTRRRQLDARAGQLRPGIAPEPGPLQATDGEELQAGLGKALRNLPATDRRLVALYYGAGLNQAQIAANLSISQRLVSHRLKNAVEQLRHNLRRLDLLAGAAPDWEAWLIAQLSTPPRELPGLAEKIALPPPHATRAASTAATRSRFSSRPYARWAALGCLATILALAFLPRTPRATEPSSAALPAAGEVSAAGPSLAAGTARVDEVVYAEEFDPGRLDPFWKSDAPASSLRLQRLEFSKVDEETGKPGPEWHPASVLTLSAQLPGTANLETVQETAIRSGLINLKGWDAGRFEMVSHAPTASGPTQYGLILYNDKGRIIWQQGYRIDSERGGKGFLVREICGNEKGFLDTNFGHQLRPRLVGMRYDLNFVTSSPLTTETCGDLLGWNRYEDPRAFEPVSNGVTQTGPIPGFQTCAYVKAFPGGSIQWSLDRCRFSRSKGRPDKGPISPRNQP